MHGPNKQIRNQVNRILDKRPKSAKQYDRLNYLEKKWQEEGTSIQSHPDLPNGFAFTVIDEETGKAMEYRDLIKDPKHKERWLKSGAKEIGTLFQGVGKNEDGIKRVKGTNTCFFIAKPQVPKQKKVSYANFVVDV